MTDRYSKSLCRICLQDGATYPIFEQITNENSIFYKLRECFTEKIDDLEGYPRHICLTCNNTLETVYDFVLRLKKTHKILKERLVSLKQENDDSCSDTRADYYREAVELKAIISAESEIFLVSTENTEQFIDLLQPLQNITKKEIKNQSDKAEIRVHKKHKNKYNNGIDKVAASVLEGEFVWTGETWCLKATQLKIPKYKVKARKRDTRLKLPKKTVIKQSKLCDVCGDTFKTQYRLSVHRNMVHFNNPMQCTLCTRICTSESNLLRHMKRKHGEKNLICSTCGARFAFRGELTNHTKKVHSEKPKPKYNCKFCDKSYNCQKSKVIHERSAHTGERPAECTICSKSFFHVEYLKEHMRLHTGEAPFKCPVCERGYAQRCNMKSHLRKHRLSEIDAVTLSKMRPNYLKLLKA